MYFEINPTNIVYKFLLLLTILDHSNLNTKLIELQGLCGVID